MKETPLRTTDRLTSKVFASLFGTYQTGGFLTSVEPLANGSQEHHEAYAEDLACLRLTAVPLPQTEQQRFLRPILKDEAKKGITQLHMFLWKHQGSLQRALRQLAAVPASLRDLDGLMGLLHGAQFPENMAKMMQMISAHACAAVHPSSETLAALKVEWLRVAKRVLAAARSCLEDQEVRVVEVSALSVTWRCWWCRWILGVGEWGLKHEKSLKNTMLMEATKYHQRYMLHAQQNFSSSQIIFSILVLPIPVIAQWKLKWGDDRAEPEAGED